MKRIILLALAVSGFCATAQTNYPGGISGCIARWDFAQSPGPVSSVADVSGNGHNSSSVNNLTSTLGFRNVGNKAMVFNGFNSSATIPHATSLQPSAMTIVSLVRVNNFYPGPCQGNVILSKGTDQTSGCYMVSIHDNVFDGSCATYSPTKEMYQTGFGATNVNASLTPGNYVTSGQWYFCASSYDGTTVRHYVALMDPNNYITGITPFFQANVSASIGANTDNVLLGRHIAASAPYYFSGLMDEVALFNRVLTDAEVQSVYDYLWGIVAVTNVPTNICTGQSFSVSYSVNNTSFFSSTNTFTVQLSNASGSFATPTNIGSVTATTGGTINCTVPGTVADGSGYRIRIVGSSVAYTGRDNGINLTVTNITKPSVTSNTPVCAGQTLNLSGSSSTPGVTYNWNGPLSFSSNQQNPALTNVTTAHAGSYTLYTTKNGCTSQTDTETVVIGSNIPPTVTSYASPGDTICIGGTAAFYALVTSGANPQYQWMKNGVPIPGETSPTYVTKTLATGDVVYCEVTSSGCSSMLTGNSNVHTIFLIGKSPASVSISANPGLLVSPWQLVTFTANVANGGLTPTYQWKLNGNDVLGATGQTWSTNNLANNDAVSVVVKSSSDCAEPAIATSQAVMVNIKTSVNDIKQDNSISIYPNPNNGAFTVTFKDAPPVAGQIEVLNAVGQIVHRQQYTARSSSVVVDMPHVAQGVYLMKMDIDGKAYRSRIVISK